MTEVFQMLEKEKQEAIKLAEQKTITRVAENLIKDEVDTVIIMRATGLSEEEIEEIKKSIQEQYANNKEGYLSIKKVIQMLEIEKLDAVNTAVQNERYKANEKTVKSLLYDGADTVVIMRATGLSGEEIEKIKSSMMTTK